VNAPLFVREPETLDGFIPPFTRHETKLGFQMKTVKVGRGLGVCTLNDDDDEPLYDYRYSITVAGQTYTGQAGHYDDDVLEVVVRLVNELLSSSTCTQAAREWLRENHTALNTSLFYWRAQRRLEEIAKAERELAELQERITKARIYASIDAVQVKRGVRLTDEERALLYAEFAGVKRTEQ
jgi:hypothetical protein